MGERWIEVRCPACRDLGWVTADYGLRSPALLGVFRNVANQGEFQAKCNRCKSVSVWIIGKPEFRIIFRGKQRKVKSNKVAFE